MSNPISTVIPSVEGRVLQVLARTDMPLSGSRIAALIPNVSVEGVRRALHRLLASGFVIAEPVPPAILYSANGDHLLWPAVALLMSDADQIVLLLQRRIIKFIDMLIRDKQDRERLTIALYGSVARGDSRPDSDIDVVLIAPDDMREEAVDGLVSTLIDGVEAATGNECNVYAATRSQLDQLIEEGDPMIASWLSDAVTFQGPDLRRYIKASS
ncbi:nucleotidyltransferase domain-containing protein [Pengzhenrongella sp.]|jgi:predicted nucleotidyltransferase|uniref:nucleotidyltransferase domain-containing protein n=1 Tax=Pengzhenrongella sp. TaxID=2888820 RepID=UPI002F93F008